MQIQVHGNRPSFTDAAKPEEANRLYEYFKEKCKESGIDVECRRIWSTYGSRAYK